MKFIDGDALPTYIYKRYYVIRYKFAWCCECVRAAQTRECLQHVPFTFCRFCVRSFAGCILLCCLMLFLFRLQNQCADYQAQKTSVRVRAKYFRYSNDWEQLAHFGNSKHTFDYFYFHTFSGFSLFSHKNCLRKYTERRKWKCVISHKLLTLR